MFSVLYQIMVNKVTFVGFMGGDRPIRPPLDPPLPTIAIGLHQYNTQPALMLLCSTDKSSKYTANKCGLNTPLSNPISNMKRFRQMGSDYLYALFVPCTSVSVAAQNTLAHSSELISQIISCVILGRMLSRHLKNSMH